MSFLWPNVLWLLALPLALLATGFRRRRQKAALNKHPQIIRAQARLNSIKPVSGKVSGPRAFRPLFPLALAFAIVALARPQWGRVEQPVFDQAREILVAVDLSNSMLAQDVSPSRLERSRLLITSLLQKLKGERVGLVVFAGSSFLQSPLSADHEILGEFLPLLNTSLLPQGGTNYTALLNTSIEAFGSSSAADRFLIILSDGEAHDNDWRQYVDILKTKNIKVVALGIGTADGGTIPTEDGFLKDDRGAVVLSRLESATLQELANATDGVYTDASMWVDINELIQSTVEKGRQGEFSETSHSYMIDRFQYPLAAALFFFLLGLWIDIPSRPRPRKIRMTGGGIIGLIAISLLLSPRPFAQQVQGNKEAPPIPQTTQELLDLVGKLSSSDKTLTPADYLEIAHKTLSYGHTLKGMQQAVQESPVHDAIHATEKGEALDASFVDWADIRRQLEDLLKPPPEQNQDNQQNEQNQDQQDQQQDQNEQQDQQNQNQDSSGQSGDSDNKDKQDQQDNKENDQQDQDNKGQDKQENNQQQGQGQDKQQEQGGGNNEQPQDQEQQSGTDPKQEPQDKENQEQPQDAPQEGQQNQDQTPQNQPDQQQPQDQEQQQNQTPPTPRDEEAFGKMEPPQTPAPIEESPENMQQVGGTPLGAGEPDPAAQDPALAVPLQKLDQLKDKDSPAILFQRLNKSDPQPDEKPKQNW